MSDFSLFTADHHGFYRNGDPFFPLIQEQTFPLMDWSNAVLLRLPAQLNDDLDWSKEREFAAQIASSGKSIFWEMDLGLSPFQFTPENSAAFFSFSLALEEFTAKIWPEFQKQTFGVALYRGGAPSPKNFPLTSWESGFLDWSSEFKTVDLESSFYDLYCMQMLGEYLHRLISFLPETVLPFALFDVSLIRSPGKIAQLFSKNRFEHVQLALKGAKCPFAGICWGEGQNAQGILSEVQSIKESISEPSLGLYFPKDPHIDRLFIQQLDSLISQFNEKQIPFRIISEEKLTEEWDGIDHLIVPSQAISGQGRRKLLGFIATGGNVTNFEGASFTFPGRISAEREAPDTAIFDEGIASAISEEKG
jgi:hypothetical protein